MAAKKRNSDAAKQVKNLKPIPESVRGGSKVMANAHEMKKSLISNFPR